MPEKPQYDVFLSYSTQDRDLASAITSALKDSGISTWFDAHEIRAGERWEPLVEEALRESRVLVLILNTENLNRPGTFFEIGAAVADSKRIVAVLAEDVDVASLPPLLRQLQSVKERSPREAARRVAEAVAHSSKRAS
jgi:hypothetical protein